MHKGWTMTPQEKKDFDAVLKKYKRSRMDIAKSYLKKIRTGAIIGVGLDLMFTAGFGTVLAISAAALPALKAAFRSAAKHGVLTRDKQQQDIKAGADVVIILADLEFALSNVYKVANTAPRKNAGETEIKTLIEARKVYLKLADEVEADIRKLEPAIKIVSGGNGNYGTEKYQILVREEWGTRQPEKFHPLDETRGNMQKQIAELEKTLAENREREKVAAERAAQAAKKKPGFNL